MKKKERITEIIRGRASRNCRFLPLAMGIFAILFLLSFSGTITSTSSPISSVRTGDTIPGLALRGSTANFQVIPTVQSSSAQVVPTFPTPPTALGCAYYTNGQWQTIPCLKQSAGPNIPKPTEGGSAGVYGLNQSSLLTSTRVKVNITTFSGETDSMFGSGAFSIQGNTNPFTGSNGNEYGIQFTEQSDPGEGWANACIWQVDITTQQYPYTCVDNPVQTLAAGYSVYISATAKNGKLGIEFCVNSKTCYAVTAKDDYGLEKHWTQFSGTLLGLGDGSEAEFTKPTAMTANVYLFFLDNAKVFNTGPYTGESNNLNVKSNNVTCNPNGKEDCELISKSTN